MGMFRKKTLRLDAENNRAVIVTVLAAVEVAAMFSVNAFGVGCHG